MENSDNIILTESLTQVMAKLSDISISLSETVNQLLLISKLLPTKQPVLDLPTMPMKEYALTSATDLKTGTIYNKKDFCVIESNDSFIIKVINS